MKAERTGIVLKPDPKRVLFRPFNPHTEERALKIVARVMNLSCLATWPPRSSVTLAGARLTIGCAKLLAQTAKSTKQPLR